MGRRYNNLKILTESLILIGAAAITIETFKRRKITEQLELSESTFRSAFEFAGIGVGMTSLEDKWIKVNKEFCRIVGYTEQEMLSMTVQEITHPDDRAIDLELFHQIIMGKRDNYKIEKRYVHNNGSIVWVSLNTSVVRDADGRPLFLLRQAEDITEEKRTKSKLEYSLSLNRATIEGSADGILVVDILGNVSDYNQKFLDQWRIPVDVVNSSNTTELVAYVLPQVVDPEGFETRIAEIRAGISLEAMDIIRCVDGRVFERYHKPQIVNNEIVGRVWSFKDITEQKRVEEEIKHLNADLENRVALRTLEVNQLNEQLQLNVQNLEQANKDLESFSYSVSHDLRAPLRAINGFVTILEKRNTNLDDESKKFMGIITDNTRKMNQLIEDMLAFSRSGRTELQKQDLDMNALLQSVLDSINIHEWNPKTEVIVGNMLPAHGDENLLKQVLLNLVGNAVKYSRTKEKPLIEIGSTAGEKENTYFIKDNGVGFSMEYYDKLFKVFQRLHAVEDFEGVGVGLAIVQRIVVRHGGKVWAEAKVDEGATFYFSLLAANNEGQSTAS